MNEYIQPIQPLDGEMLWTNQRMEKIHEQIRKTFGIRTELLVPGVRFNSAQEVVMLALEKRLAGGNPI